MKCWFCDKDAKGTCAACGRGLCADGESLSPVVPAFPPASVFLLLVDRNVP